MIKIDYGSARACAKKLSNVADTCRQMSNRTTKLINNISACWQGNSAAAFMEELSKWKKENESIRRELIRLSSKINHATDEFAKAEEKFSMSNK